MKKIIFGLIAFVLFANLSFGQDRKVVGNSVDGKFVINFNAQQVLKKVNTETNDKYLMSKIEIKQGIDTVTGDKYYYLFVQNRDENVSMAFDIQLESSGEFVLYATSGTVTCTGCRYGCNPEKVKKEWWCNAGCGYDWTKTVTITTKFMIASITDM